MMFIHWETIFHFINATITKLNRLIVSHVFLFLIYTSKHIPSTVYQRVREGYTKGNRENKSSSSEEFPNNPDNIQREHPHPHLRRYNSLDKGYDVRNRQSNCHYGTNMKNIQSCGTNERLRPCQSLFHFWICIGWSFRWDNLQDAFCRHFLLIQQVASLD